MVIVFGKTGDDKYPRPLVPGKGIEVYPNNDSFSQCRNRNGDPRISRESTWLREERWHCLDLSN